ncbi:MAG: division/cell wall cluster transcriptional repressor MraZ [Desulfatiglandales bacterium]
MFRGRSSHTLDDKGRLIIPARFMDYLNAKGEDTLVLTNYEDCLWGFPKTTWEKLEEKAASLPLFQPAAIAYQRFFISGAEYCQIKNGKITIPYELRKLAGIDRDVMLVGATLRFEIWDKGKWEESFNNIKRDFNTMQSELNQFGI